MSASPAVRPLPPRPSLEYERKEAKALLRRLRAGDPDALARARARHPAFDPARPRLADAQLVLAREYGFASWPRLARYFGDAERLQQRVRRSLRSSGGPGVLESSVRSLLAEHRAGVAVAARQLAAYVPRFYGLRADAVLAAEVTEDDARLAVARVFGMPSWATAVEWAEAQGREQRRGGWDDVSPLRHASDAMAAADLGALERVVAEHPELLRPSDDDVAVRRTLIGAALGHEWTLGADAMRPVMDWLAARGFDRQLELNALLCGRLGMPAAEVRGLLDRGADPGWVAPNGIPVLEHALLRYWNAEAVDLVAARVTPRRALWIAAGLGDVDGVRGFLDARGRPTRAARRLRPDFDAAGPGAMPSLPDPDDEELLVEALFVAVLNGRGEVIAELVARGAPVNSLMYGLPLAYFAAGNGLTASLEALVRCGADLDLRGRHPDQSAREMARELFEQHPGLGERRRVVALCGMDPDAVLAERDARPAPTPQFDLEPQLALELAGDDALRLGESEVRAEHVLVGQLRVDGFARWYLIGERWLTADQLRAAFGDRLRPADDRAPGAPPPLGAGARAVVDAAVALAAERRREWLDGSYLLAALAAEGGPAAELLARHGKDAAAMRAALVELLGV